MLFCTKKITNYFYHVNPTRTDNSYSRLFLCFEPLERPTVKNIPYLAKQSGFLCTKISGSEFMLTQRIEIDVFVNDLV